LGCGIKEAKLCTGLFVKFSAYIEIKAMFERSSGSTDGTLKPWQHMVIRNIDDKMNNAHGIDVNVLL